MTWQLAGAPSAWLIYTLLCPFTGAVRYVGFTADVESRLKRHIKNGRSMERDYPVNRWINSLVRDGLLPDCVVIQTGSGPWEGAEAQWISYFRYDGQPLLNVCDGGFFSVPEEARKRAGEKMKGRIISEERKEALRIHFTGCKRPDAVELAKRLAESNRGKKRVMTDAVKRACRENGLAAKGNLRHWPDLTPAEQEARALMLRTRALERYAAMTAEQKAARSAAIRAGTPVRVNVRQQQRLKRRADLAAMSDAARAELELERKAKHRAGMLAALTPEYKAKKRAGMLAAYAASTPEQRSARTAAAVAARRIQK